jgi:hypothetical protein
MQLNRAYDKVSPLAEFDFCGFYFCAYSFLSLRKKEVG